MRVDNNWEDSIGKRLHDFEGDLSPQDWNNINKRLQPGRKHYFRWLPLLLCFLALPGILYFSGDPGTTEQKTSGVAPQNGPENASEYNAVAIPVNEKSTTSEVPYAANQASELPENGSTLEAKTQPHALAYAQPAEANSGGVSNSNPANNVLITGALVSSRPEVITLPEKDKSVKSRTQDKEDLPVTKRILQTGSAKLQAGKLAFNEARKNNVNTITETGTANYAAKTVGISTEKLLSQDENPGGSFTAKTVGSEVLSISNTAETTENKQELAFALNRTSSLSHAGLAAIILPDTIKEQLVTGLPQAAIANETKKADKRTSIAKDWEFGIYGTPHYTFQRVLPNRDDQINILKLANKNTIESERFGYEFGARSYYPVRENLKLTLGFQIASLNQHVDLITQNNLADSAVVEQQGNTITMQVYNRQQRETHLFKYYFGGLFTGANLAVAENLELTGGLGLNWLLHAKSDMQDAETENFNVNPYLSFGLKYNVPLANKLQFNVGPAMQYYLKPVQDKQAMIGVKPTMLGLMVGLQFKP